MGDLSRRYDRRPLLIGAAVALIMLGVGCVDFAHTSGQVPDVSGEAFQERLDRVFELEDDLGARAWIYAAIALAAVLIAATVTFTRTPPDARRELFTDLGVGGVAWLILGGVAMAVSSDSILNEPTKQVFYPAFAVLAVAAGGTVFTRRPAREPRAGTRTIRIACVVATGVAAGLAALSLSSNGDPCTSHVSGSVESLNAVGLVAAAIAVIVGLVAVARRLWIAGLASLVIGPLAVLLALFSTVCWN
jgi:hypothetical protein